MGYTHYWNRPTELPKPKFKEFLKQVKRIISLSNVTIGDAFGTGNKPSLTEDLISFNGIGEDSHETFYMPRVHKDMSFECTKTARKPYDKVVVACLLAFKDVFGHSVNWSSDGGLYDHREGIALYELATGKDFGSYNIAYDTASGTEYLYEDSEDNEPQIFKTVDEAVKLIDEMNKDAKDANMEALNYYITKY